MGPLAGDLTRLGHDVSIAPLGLNMDCGEGTMAPLLAVVDERRPEVLIGHSRGGQLAVVAAVRRPDLIEQVITVGTPWAVGPPNRFGVPQMAAVLRRAGPRAGRLMAAVDCGTADCCSELRADLDRPPVAHWTALWSSRDRIAGVLGRPPANADDEEDLRLGHLRMIVGRRGRQAIMAHLGGNTCDRN